MRPETPSVKVIASVWLPFVLEGHMEKKHIMMSLEEIKQTILTTLPVFHSLSMSSIDTTCTCLFFIKKGSLQHGTLELGKNIRVYHERSPHMFPQLVDERNYTFSPSVYLRKPGAGLLTNLFDEPINTHKGEKTREHRQHIARPPVILRLKH